MEYTGKVNILYSVSLINARLMNRWSDLQNLNIKSLPNNPHIKGIFADMIESLNQAIDEEITTNESIEDVFESMDAILKVYSKHLIKSIVAGEEDYKNAIEKLKKDKKINDFKGNVMDSLIIQYTKKLMMIEKSDHNIIIT